MPPPPSCCTPTHRAALEAAIGDMVSLISDIEDAMAEVLEPHQEYVALESQLGSANTTKATLEIALGECMANLCPPQALADYEVEARDADGNDLPYTDQRTLQQIDDSRKAVKALLEAFRQRHPKPETGSAQ